MSRHLPGFRPSVVTWFIPGADGRAGRVICAAAELEALTLPALDPTGPARSLGRARQGGAEPGYAERLLHDEPLPSCPGAFDAVQALSSEGPT